MTTLSSAGPISRVPYDVLTEIFLHCLPQHRLRFQQPNTRIAPMLLCHICSAWRTVALSLKTLWSHLPFCLTITHSVTNSYEYRILNHQFAFISWWRRNQGSTQPYLFINTRWHNAKMFKHPDLNDAEMLSLFKYIAAARFLEIDRLLWRLLYNWNENRFPAVYPTPHTCMKSGYSKRDYFYRFQALIPNDTPSALRYLSISDDMLPKDFVIPNHWSKLTRLALDDVVIPLRVWFSLIRALPDLQWGYFNISPPNGEHIQPAKYTLPHLSTLSITLLDLIGSSFEFPLSTLFTNLHLPALHTLSLFSSEESWSNHHAITELYTVLHSTPAIRALILEDFFLSLSDYPIVILPAIRDIEPVWHHATQLVHLQFRLLTLRRTPGMTTAMVKESLSTILRNIFLPDNHFLDLNNPACPIQKITLIANRPSDSHFQSESMRNFTMDSIREHLQTAPNVKVIFEVISDSEDYTASGARNEWGPVP